VASGAARRCGCPATARGAGSSQVEESEFTLVSSQIPIDGAARSFPAAAAILADRDPVLRRLIAEIGPPHLRRPADGHFAALVRAIVYQQLAGAAAAAIHGRLITALGGEATPAWLLALPDSALRSAGLFRSKSAYLRDLATKVLDGTVVLDPPRLGAESDAEVVASLSSVRGIGAWTAQMFLLFQLRRLDVWPARDLGARRGYELAWGVPTPPRNSSSRSATRTGRTAASWPGTAGEPLSGTRAPQKAPSPGRHPEGYARYSADTASAESCRRGRRHCGRT
jgi:DNA-3-methyladenine glycosylase II